MRPAFLRVTGDAQHAIKVLTGPHPQHRMKARANIGLRRCPLVQRLGQLTLDQHIGVRIPGGQPITFRKKIFGVDSITKAEGSQSNCSAAFFVSLPKHRVR